MLGNRSGMYARTPTASIRDTIVGGSLVLIIGATGVISTIGANIWAGLCLVLPFTATFLFKFWRISAQDAVSFFRPAHNIWPWFSVATIISLEFLVGFPTLDRHATQEVYEVPQRNWLGISARLQDPILRLAPNWMPSNNIGILFLDDSLVSYPPAIEAHARHRCTPTYCRLRFGGTRYSN